MSSAAVPSLGYRLFGLNVTRVPQLLYTHFSGRAGVNDKRKRGMAYTCSFCGDKVPTVYAMYSVNTKHVKGDVWACESCWMRRETLERRINVRNGERKVDTFNRARRNQTYRDYREMKKEMV